MTRFSLWQAIGLGILVAGLSVATPDPVRAQGAARADVTFSKDVAPIFQAKCQVCHRPGSIGPMSLLTFEDARPWVRSIRTRVASREMPPWHLDKTVGIQHFINDASLTDQQIDTIVRWVDAGAPRGNPADLPPPVKFPNEDQFRLESVLGPPDLVIKSKPWTMPAQAQDTHFRPQVDIPLTKGRWVRASETKPSLKGRRIAHHASTYLVRPEGPDAVEAERAMRAGQPGAELALAIARDRGGNDNPFGNRELFTEWAQGKDGEIYPPNVGKLVMPGSKVEFDIHYHAVGEEITDELETAWWFYPEDYTPKFSSEWMAIGAVRDLQIPPNTVTQHQGSFVLPAPAMLHNFQPHMHYRGKAFMLEAILPDGRREVVNYADRYTNTWHINYIYHPDHAPVYPKGTVLQITAWHDNTAANPNNPDPRQWVTGGPRTVDEMAHHNAQIIYLSDEEYQRITEERQKRRPTNTQN
jgi:hypothetical protein